MKTFVKKYIGKGKKVDNPKLNSEVVEVALSLEEIQKYTFKKDGKEWIKFAIGQRQNPDNYGKTHNVWVTTLVETEDEQQAPKKKTTRKSTKK